MCCFFLLFCDKIRQGNHYIKFLSFITEIQAETQTTLRPPRDLFSVWFYFIVDFVSVWPKGVVTSRRFSFHFPGGCEAGILWPDVCNATVPIVLFPRFPEGEQKRMSVRQFQFLEGWIYQTTRAVNIVVNNPSINLLSVKEGWKVVNKQSHSE